MKQRVWTMARYLLRSLALSWTGIIYLLLTLVYWLIFFPPQQGTPDSDNYIVIIGVFGPAMTFLVALSLTTLANQAFNYPLVVRLASRVEYLTAVLLATLIFSTALQLLLAVLALISGPDLTLAHIAEIPPIWIAPNVLAAVLAMHASDFVTAWPVSTFLASSPSSCWGKAAATPSAVGLPTPWKTSANSSGSKTGFFSATSLPSWPTGLPATVPAR